MSWMLMLITIITYEQTMVMYPIWIILSASFILENISAME